MATMGLSGLWHGAAWNFVAWGLFHGLLLVLYRTLGLGKRWQPAGRAQWLGAWTAMSLLTLIGWMLFRAPSLGWLATAVTAAEWGLAGDPLLGALFVMAFVAVHAMPWGVAHWLERHRVDAAWTRALCRCSLLGLIVIVGRETANDFIYFQF
jgi:D-alanyl-lipoteichoic acid acyltransferase DltB (MBOAT superfamily)